MSKKEKMSLEDYCVSAAIIEIISGVSNGSCYKGAYNPDLLNHAVDNGYVEYNVSNNELLRLTKRGESIHRKLQHCILADIKKNSPHSLSQ
jgi:hypothetical protein